MTKRERKYHTWNYAFKMAKRWFIQNSMIPPDKSDINWYLNYVYKPKIVSLLDQIKPLMDLQTKLNGKMQDMIGIPDAREIYDGPKITTFKDEFPMFDTTIGPPKPGKTSFHYIIPKRKKP